jgi:VWFA-related protein
MACLAAFRNPVLLTCLFAAACWPQDRPAFRSSLNLVTIPCTVVDANGKPVTGLTREEFRVYNNGVRRIAGNLWFDTDRPLMLGVIIDTSESQQDQLAEHRETALALLQRILRPGDRAFVVSVGGEVRLWADLAGAAAEIRKQMAADPGERVGQPCPARPAGIPGFPAASVCGGSPLWNAVYATARLKLRPLTGNRALLILTDGFDTGSTHTWREAADEIARAEAAVYAIQYRSGLGGRFAPDLYRLLEESGGAWFGAPAGEEYGPIVSRIETDLRRRYVLGFRPDAAGGRVRHEVRVEVTRPDLVVRARKAYFLAPQ